MNAKILEIFRSVQGEGKYVGAPQVFVRFFECNMHCVWCDTPASIGDGKREYQEINSEDLLARVNTLDEGCHSVTITGGEPLVQKDFLKGFCRALRKEGKTVYLDTNGTLPQALKHLIKDIDIIAMDIKLPSSTKQKAFWAEHKEFLKIAARKEVFIKTVVSTVTSEADILKAARLVAQIDPNILFILQPNYLEMKKGLVEMCVDWQKHCAKILKDVRILPQVHKFMKLR
ncbi:MAG: 7-carboxy-7-deazaguanine synthase QueE [Candidatus Omnitrophica bacterium]|nr:7-carboxy-7-deazaguanine synthase QueE [Candidatus Omnitrophota bacterium]